MIRRSRSRVFFLPIATFAILFVACAKTRPSLQPSLVPDEPAQAPQPMGSVKELDVAGPPCAAYSIDGIALGMTLDQARAIQPLTRSGPEESPTTGKMESIYYFGAARPGRKDHVQVGLDSDAKEARVVSIRATIVAGESDSWPGAVFKMIGSPRLGKLDEWGWWTEKCGAAMKIDRISAIGSSSQRGQPYKVEIRPFP